MCEKEHFNVGTMIVDSICFNLPENLLCSRDSVTGRSFARVSTAEDRPAHAGREKIDGSAITHLHHCF